MSASTFGRFHELKVFDRQNGGADVTARVFNGVESVYPSPENMAAAFAFASQHY